MPRPCAASFASLVRLAILTAFWALVFGIPRSRDAARIPLSGRCHFAVFAFAFNRPNLGRLKFLLRQPNPLCNMLATFQDGESLGSLRFPIVFEESFDVINATVINQNVT